jgi:hypothetical protein
MFGLPNEEAGMVIALTCMCDGITPIDYLRRYHTINGRPSMRSDAMLAEFRMNHGGDHVPVERTAEKATIILVKSNGTEYSFSLTWKEADEAGWPYYVDKDGKTVTKDTWNSSRGTQTMLWARVVSDAIRVVCPEVNAGVYTPEEMGDVATGNGIAAKVVETPVEAVEAESVEPIAAVSPLADSVEAVPSTMKQNLEIKSLFTELRISGESQLDVLKKRNAHAIEELSHDQAEELLGKMRAKAREAAGN